MCFAIRLLPVVKYGLKVTLQNDTRLTDSEKNITTYLQDLQFQITINSLASP